MGKYMTTKEAAEKWDISPRRINVLCKNERIPGAYKENKQWFIPVDVVKPADKRMKERCLMFPLIDKRETGINLRRIMDMRGITAKDVQEYLGLSCVQSVYRWLDGINMPTIDNLYALSELFQVPIDAIVRGNRTPIASDIMILTLASQERRLYAYHEKLSKKHVA